MGKLSLRTNCGKNHAGVGVKFSVYFDDKFQGEYVVGDTAALPVMFDCEMSIMINGKRYEGVSLSGSEEMTMLAEYDEHTGSLSILNHHRRNCFDSSVEVNNNRVTKLVNNTKVKKKSVWEKLLDAGGWVNYLFYIWMAMLALGTIIAFFSLVGDLPGLAFIVLISGVFAMVFFWLEYLLAGYFYFSAVDKGYKDLFYLFFPWIFPLIGHLLVVSLPDRGSSKNHEKE